MHSPRIALPRIRSLTIVIPLTTLFAALVLACSSAADGAGDAAMRVDAVCLETVCDQRRSDARELCDDCTMACIQASYGCDPSQACSASCAEPRPCSSDEAASCAKTGFVARLPTDGSPALSTACKRMVQTWAACGRADVTLPSEGDCERFAVVERPERASVYECVAGLPCDADPASCPSETTSFGAELCAQADATCGKAGSACEAGLADRLDLEGAWLRADVMDAARTCAAQATCADVKACLNAWVKAVLG